MQRAVILLYEHEQYISKKEYTDDVVPVGTVSSWSTFLYSMLILDSCLQFNFQCVFYVL